MNLLQQWGYAQCFGCTWRSRVWARIWYYFFCPYPVIDDPRASACVKAGACGCDNARRFGVPSTECQP